MADSVGVETVIIMHFMTTNEVPDDICEKIVQGFEKWMGLFIAAGELPGYRDCCAYAMEGKPGEYHSKELLPGVGVIAPPVQP